MPEGKEAGAPPGLLERVLMDEVSSWKIRSLLTRNDAKTINSFSPHLSGEGPSGK
jgi:hypothetical protein